MNKKQLTDLSVWRFVVATAFLNQCQKVNDNYVYSYSHTKLELDIEAVKLAMINNIEGAFTEKYGTKQGIEKAEKMYSYMLENPALYGAETKDYKLSQLGNQMMNELFKSMVEMFEADMSSLSSSTIH